MVCGSSIIYQDTNHFDFLQDLLPKETYQAILLMEGIAKHYITAMVLFIY
jgi:hypothetical protein